MANEIYNISWWGSPTENGWGNIYYDFAFPNVDTTSFITTWRTTADNETITIPTNGSGYNYTVKTSDGRTFTNTTGDQTIAFATAGDYDVSISGTFSRIYFNFGGDKTKIIDVKQWGNMGWTSFLKAFYGCVNLQISATDAPDLSNVTSLQNSLRSCLSLNPDIGHWDVSNITTMRGMFQSTSFNQNISNWDITSVSNFQDFIKANNTLSTLNYDAILEGWVTTLDAYVADGNTYSFTPTASFGGAKYTAGGTTEAARDKLQATYGWNITDGGAV